MPVFLFAASLLVTLLIAPRTPVYWDTFGYVTQALAGDVGGLGLGRPVFTLVNQGIARAWLETGGSPQHVEAILRAWCTFVSCLAAPLAWRLARACRLSERASLIAGLAVACSPAFAHAGGSVLTDGPAATLFLAACIAGVTGTSGAMGTTGTTGTRGTSGTRNELTQSSFLDLEAKEDAPRKSGRHHVPDVPRVPVVPNVLFLFISGLLSGLAVGVREQSVLNVATFALLAFAVPPARRVRFALAFTAGFAIAVVAPLVFVYVTQPGYVDTVRTWMAGMRHDRAIKTYGWCDAAIFAGWILSLGPAVVAAAAIALTTSRGTIWRPGSALFALVVPGLAQLFVLSLFIGIGYSPRFLLTPFVVAIAIPGALAFDIWIGGSRARFVAVLLMLALPAAIAAPVLRARSAPVETLIRETSSRLASVPSNSVIVTGQACPSIPLAREIAVKDPGRTSSIPDWQAICPGWAWPDDLSRRLALATGDGRPVVIDLRPGAWVGAEQQRAQDDVQRYLEGQAALAEDHTPPIVWR